MVLSCAPTRAPDPAEIAQGVWSGEGDTGSVTGISQPHDPGAGSGNGDDYYGGGGGGSGHGHDDGSNTQGAAGPSDRATLGQVLGVALVTQMAAATIHLLEDRIARSTWTPELTDAVNQLEKLGKMALNELEHVGKNGKPSNLTQDDLTKLNNRINKASKTLKRAIDTRHDRI